MKENMYDLLNNTEVDLSEYEEGELSLLEKDKAKARIVRKIKIVDMKKKRRMKKAITRLVAVFVVAIGIGGFVNTTFAKELFSMVFQALIDKADDVDMYVGAEEVYRKIGKNATPVQADDESYIVSAEENDVEVEVRDVYCDGYILYYTLLLQTNNDKLNGAQKIWPETANAMVSVDVEGIDSNKYGLGFSVNAFRKVKEGVYASMNEVYLLDSVENDELIINLNIPGFRKTEIKEDLSMGEDEIEETCLGKWHLRFPVSVQKSGNKVYDIQKEDKGVCLKKAIKTKVGLLLEMELLKETEGYYASPEGGDCISGLVKDEKGNFLPYLNESDSWENGRNVKKIMVLYNGQKNLTFVPMLSKQNETEFVPITEIKFEIK